MTETMECYFTFNVEHNELLDKLHERTGKEKKQLIREAVDLALERRLEPAKYTWIDKNHRVYSVPFPVKQAEEIKKLWKGKLTPLAVAGLLAISGEETGSPKNQSISTQEILKLRDDVNRLLKNIESKPEPKVAQSARVSDSVAAAKSVRATLRQLADKLEYFKKCSETERKKFRELIDPMEVGYVTSLMKALFDEEGFQRWILATEFTRRMNDNA